MLCYKLWWYVSRLRGEPKGQRGVDRDCSGQQRTRSLNKHRQQTHGINNPCWDPYLGDLTGSRPVIPVSVRKTLLRRWRLAGNKSFKTPNPGLESSLCCCIARQRLAQKTRTQNERIVHRKTQTHKKQRHRHRMTAKACCSQTPVWGATSRIAKGAPGKPRLTQQQGDPRRGHIE